MLKKIVSAILICAMAVTFTACADSNTINFDDTLPQCEPANVSHSSMLRAEYATMKSTDGYYYAEMSSRQGGKYTIYYYDTKTKTTIPLCAKPQCVHDGNDFCVATGGEQSLYTLFYNNYIYKLCCEYTEEQMCVYNLLRGDMQGNELSVATEIFTFPSTQQINIRNVLCHYGVMFFSIKKYNGNKSTDHIYSIDLATGTVREIEIENSAKYEHFAFMTADGDYLYIAAEDEVMATNQSGVKMDADTVMYRYNLKTGEIEIISDMPKIYSSFTVDNGIIYYTTVNRSDNTFSLVSYDTEKKETKTLVENRQMVYMDSKFISGNGAKVVTDRKYLYIRMPCGSGFADAEGKRGMELYIYDMNGELLYEGVLGSDKSWDMEIYSFSAIDGEIYLLCKLGEIDDNDSLKTNEASGLYAIKTDELISGNAEWHKLYQLKNV